jgi:Protein of unknown function (DUF664)
VTISRTGEAAHCQTGTVSEKIHKPSRELSDAKQLLLGYLDYYRSVIGRKVDGLPESELRSSRLPSGWTSLELVKHLTYMERRWFCWGFLAEQLPDPLGDEDNSGRWHVDDSETPGELLKALYAGGARTRAIVEGAHLADRAAVGGRFSTGDQRPTLAWTLVYVLQEYARHAGHLDAARELFDGVVGE